MDLEEDISDISDDFHKGYECLYDYIDINPSFKLKDNGDSLNTSNYCIICNDVYHNVCKKFEKIIFKISGISSNYSIELYFESIINFFQNSYEQYNIMDKKEKIKNKSNIIKLFINILKTIYYLNDCKDYRTVHHRNCSLVNNEYKPDKEHQYYLNQAQICLKELNKIKNKINKLVNIKVVFSRKYSKRTPKKSTRKYSKSKLKPNSITNKRQNSYQRKSKNKQSIKKRITNKKSFKTKYKKRLTPKKYRNTKRSFSRSKLKSNNISKNRRNRHSKRMSSLSIKIKSSKLRKKSF